jgi:bla regulator protein blaR1
MNFQAWNQTALSPFLSYTLNHVWQSTLFAVLAFLITLTLLRKNRAQVRYAVWLAASVKFLVPFAILVTLGSRLGFMKLAPPATQVRLYFAMDEAGRQPAPRLVTTALLPTTPAPSIHLSDVVLILWGCGVLLVAIRWWLSWRRVRVAVQSAEPMRTFDGIPVLSSIALRERGLEPGVLGLFQPVVLVPEGITDRLSPEQFEAVLAHECCHARRRDNLSAAIHMAVEALFWFHPLVWWMGKRMVEERERACDEDVLRRNRDPEIYAESILNVCKFYLESPLECVSGITGADLKRRIEEIMTRRVSHDLDWLRKALLAVVGAAAVAGPLVVGILNTPATHAQTMSTFDGLIRTSTTKAFEVATVKQNVSGDDTWRLGPPGHGSVSIVNLQLKKILASSFAIQDGMVFGPPSLDSDRYDIVGKGPDPTATNPEVWEMMRSLLVERFHLKFHVETRELPVYALVVAKGGPRLKRPEDGPCAAAIQAHQTCGDILYPAFGVGIRNMTVGALRSALARKLQDRPIIEKTGLTGNYDVTVRWMPEGMTPDERAAIPEQDRPEDVSLFIALERQAGLKLEARKDKVQVLIVDSLEKPGEAAGSLAPASAAPAFDAVSVKANTSGKTEVDFAAPRGSRFSATNVSLKMLLMRAFKMKNFEVEGGPSWIDSDRWDIAASSSRNSIAEPDFKLMLQALLADRFQLQAHRGTKQVQVYALLPVKNGSKLPPASGSCFPHDAPPPLLVAGQPPPLPCGGFIMDGSHLEGRQISAPLFASALSNMLGRAVIDKTGYAGIFDVHLEFAPEGIATLTGGGFEAAVLPANASDSGRPTLFTAIQQQLGLKLESQKGPDEILVIDRAARATAN